MRSVTPLLSPLVVVLLAGCVPERQADAQPRTRPRAPRRAPAVATPPAPAPTPRAPVDVGTVAPRCTSRPNILVVMTDDQRADSLACMRLVPERLAARGTTFERYYATTGLCCPSRASILTGLHTHHHGLLQNGDIDDTDPSDGNPAGAVLFRQTGAERRTVAKWLRTAGYRTGYFGKYLNDYDRVLAATPGYVPPDWSAWHAFVDPSYYNFQLVERPYGATAARRVCYPSTVTQVSAGVGRCRRDADETRPAAEHYSTDVLGTRVQDFIRESARAREPFFAVFAPRAPHEPFTSPTRYQPDPDAPTFTAAATARLDATQCPGWRWSPADRPLNYRVIPEEAPAWVRRNRDGRSEAFMAALRRQQLVSVLAVEDTLGQILDTLRAEGVDDETVVIFTSDNGLAWGERFYTRKNCAYEECGHIPLVVYDPRHPVVGGRRLSTLTANIDLAPTIAALACVTPADPVDGLDLSPLLSGAAATLPRDRLLFECWGRGPSPRGVPDTQAAVRTDRWKFVAHYTSPARDEIATRGRRQEVELYDLTGDPFEMFNLARMTPNAVRARGFDPLAVQRTQAELRVSLQELITR